MNKLLKNLLPEKYKKQLKQSFGAPDMFWSLNNLKTLGFNPSVIIDIGAYQGEWTKEVYPIFPASNFLMLEAMEAKTKFLEETKKLNPNKIDFLIQLMGASDTEIVTFHELETASSVLNEHHRTKAKSVQIKLATLDSLLHNTKWMHPDIIKLDTQGYELQILKGATETLKHTSVVLMEVSLLDIHKNVPLIADSIIFMKERGFVAYDICSFTRRPIDKALWQTDIIFTRENHFLRNEKRWGQ